MAPPPKRLFDHALAIDPYSYGAHRILAEFFLASGKYSESVREFRFLLRYHPLRDAAQYDSAAEALRRAGDAFRRVRCDGAARTQLFPSVKGTGS